MILARTKKGLIAVPVAKKGYPPVVKARSGRQYCAQESDERIRQMIRGMDHRERLIVLDEIEKIYEGQRDAV